ncbi:uncharacterized protein LOC108739583 [Agrilus planipennis]|uniref:Uncharacterized protein LOC108739583 n=1 Tax=Agrilus planipennis TaxID=224129 RepID=A0A1W4X8A7_AGRPL|nr:uncharacterized protein LOC108739583 [Agrilus planipennis]XP_018329072.1 uncharacterized protein LOC108739583 [Agrilus planipennis]
MVKFKRWVSVVMVIGLTRATHHIVRVTILAVLGLAGLYMLHTLAQDFQKIYQQIQNGQGPGRAILNTIASNPIYRNIRNNIGKTIADTLASGSPFRQASQRRDDVRKTLCADGLSTYCDLNDFNRDFDKSIGEYRAPIGALYGGHFGGETEEFKDNNKGLSSYSTKSDSKEFIAKNQNWGFTVGTSGDHSAGYVLTKRSVPSESKEYSESSNSAISDSSSTFNYPEINWEKVLSRDPASCARSLICQLAATSEKELEIDEESILNIVRIATKKEDWASKQLREALKYGETTKSITLCERYYILCPYSGKTMMKILRFFGGSS